MSVYHLLYSLLWYLLCPILLLRLLWRSQQNSAYLKGWQERLGYTQVNDNPCIWLHAVSVGETIAASPLVDTLLKRYPSHQILITNTTLTGLETSSRLFKHQVTHSYFPYDTPDIVNRFIVRANPSLLIIMETEIWPNLLSACYTRDIPVLIANARLSQRSTKGYCRLTHLIKPTLANVSLIACRSTQDQENFVRIGAKPSSTEVFGNIKFDISVTNTPHQQTELASQFAKNSLIWVAASTHKGEDEVIIECFTQLKKTHPSLILILVPRHPERFDDVYTLCMQTSFKIQRRSNSDEFHVDTEIILGDSLGEMAYWYSAANIVFMGGSLVNTGGHNPLEASVFGVPVVTGPYIFNFEDVFKVLTTAEIAWVDNSPELIQARISQLLTTSKEYKLALRQQAFKTLRNNQGATQLIMKKVEQLLPE